MTTPTHEDAQAFFDLANAFVGLANEQGEAHGPARVSAAILWAASRYNAFSWLTSAAPGKQSPEEAVEVFVAQYRKMLADNLRHMTEPPEAPKA